MSAGGSDIMLGIVPSRMYEHAMRVEKLGILPRDARRFGRQEGWGLWDASGISEVVVTGMLRASGVGWVVGCFGHQ